jgi:glutathione S-transferase
MLPLLGCKRNGAPTTEERLSDVHKARARVFVPERFVMQADHEEEARQAGYRQLDLIYRRLEDQMAVLAAQTNPDGRPVWRLFGRRTVADAFLYVMCRWKDKSPRPPAAYPALAAFKARLDADADVTQALGAEDS